MNPYFILASSLLVAGAITTAYITGYNAGINTEIANQVEDTAILEKVKTEMMSAAIDKIAEIEVKHVTIKEKAIETVISKPAYIDCKHDADFMRLINESFGFPNWQPIDKAELSTTSTIK